jgi:hypothetical protein
MHHYFEAITNLKGDALVGYAVRLVDPATGNSISLFSDNNGTPIINVSGTADTAFVDNDGDVSFYVNPGTYDLDIYAPDAATFYKRVENVPMGLNTITLASGSAVSTIVQLQAISAPVNGQEATLTDPNRAGRFIFSSSNLSTQVTADPNQGIYVAPSSDTTGASGAWVRKFDTSANVKWFGAVGDGVTDDVTAINQAIVTCGALTVGSLFFPSATYIATTPVLVPSNVSNFEMYALGIGGATISSPTTALTQVLSLAGDHILVRGLRIYLSDVTASSSWNVELTGTNVTMFGCILESPEGRSGTVMYARAGADNFTMAYCETKGSNGFNIFTAKNHKYICNKFVERATGGDDAIAIKAIYGQGDSVAENILIANNYFENTAGFVSIGSEIGRSAAADSTYSSIARGIQVIGNRGKNCTAIAYIKPGGIQNYWDGTVDSVDISDNYLEDLTGAKMAFPINVFPGRGGRVRNVTGRNNIAYGRTTWSGGAAKGVRYFIDDFTSTASTAQSSISDCDVQIKVYDPFNGVAAGGSAPGSPFGDIASINRTNPAYGTMSNITLDVEGNACSASGIVVDTQLDNVVFIKRAKMTPNINTGLSATEGGIHVYSAVDINSSEIKIGLAAGNAASNYKLETTGGNTGAINPRLPQMLAANSFIGNATGSQATATAMTATQATSLLNAFSATLKGLAPASGGGTTNFLRADGTWAAPGASVGGSSGQIQYNSSGSLAGAALADIDASGNILLLNATSTTTPAADSVALTAKRIAAGGGRVLPQVLGEDAQSPTLGYHMGREQMACFNPTPNGTGANTLGTNDTTAGTATARSVATTNAVTRTKRLAYVSASTAGSIAARYGAATCVTVGAGGSPALGGFLFTARWAVSDASAVSGANMFIGLRNATSAPSATANPNTLTNLIGVGQCNGSTNLQIVYGGSAAQTVIDLGANFPAADTTALYELILYARPDDGTKCAYQVTNLSTGNTTSGLLSGTAGVALPASTTLMTTALYRANNATALAVGLDIANYTLET